MPRVDYVKEREQHFKFSLDGLLDQQGQFEILAMTAGTGNGWEFSEECLRASLDLWEGVECFVDHGGWFGGRSVRDLGGVCSSPRWSDDKQTGYCSICRPWVPPEI